MAKDHLAAVIEAVTALQQAVRDAGTLGGVTKIVFYDDQDIRALEAAFKNTSYATVADNPPKHMSVCGVKFVSLAGRYQ